MEKLGIEVPLLITQIVNFSIMLIVLTWFLYKPILRALKERKNKIEEGLKYTEKAKQELEKWQMKKQELLKEARDESRVILENAKKEAGKVKEDLIKEGKEEIESLRTRMEKEIQVKEEQITKEVTNHTADVAIAMVKRLLGTVLTKEDQHKLIAQQLTKMVKTHEKR